MDSTPGATPGLGLGAVGWWDEHSGAVAGWWAGGLAVWACGAVVPAQKWAVG